MNAVPAPAGGTQSENPLGAMSRILDRPPVTLADGLRGDTLLTGRWSHGPVHDSLPGLASHVIVAHHGGDADISLRNGDGLRLRSTTRQGTIVIIPSGHDGRWDIGGQVDVSHVYLTPERLHAAAGELSRGRAVELIDRVGFEDPTITRILTMLSDEAMMREGSSRLFTEQAIDLLCTQLVRAHSTISALPDPAPRRGLAEWQVKRVTIYMQSMMEQDVGLDELAALVGLSRFHFCTAFRLATGKTPHEWLTGLRIARARQLLADPALPVTEIGLCVGYQTPSSFAAAFRRLTGMTPSEFRRRHAA